jgi:predicted nucleic acid-binding protein
MTRFVLDCSMTMAWCFRDEGGSRPQSVFSSFETFAAIVPGIWALEVANVLVACERRNRLSAADVATFLNMLKKYPIDVDEDTATNAFGEVLSLARTHRLTAYDAAYLELALRTGCPLASLDLELNAAATGLGIALFNG